MGLAELCKKTTMRTGIVVGSMAALASPVLLGTNHVGYKLARISYGDEPCAEYQRPENENLIAYATLGIGRDLYIRDKCGTQFLD